MWGTSTWRPVPAGSWDGRVISLWNVNALSMTSLLPCVYDAPWTAFDSLATLISGWGFVFIFISITSCACIVSSPQHCLWPPPVGSVLPPSLALSVDHLPLGPMFMLFWSQVCLWDFYLVATARGLGGLNEHKIIFLMVHDDQKSWGYSSHGAAVVMGCSSHGAAVVMGLQLRWAYGQASQSFWKENMYDLFRLPWLHSAVLGHPVLLSLCHIPSALFLKEHYELGLSWLSQLLSPKFTI